MSNNMDRYEIGAKDILLELRDFHSDTKYTLEMIEQRVTDVERVIRRISEQEIPRTEFAYDELD